MENTKNDVIEIDLWDLFLALKEKALVILAAGLLVACLGCAYTAFAVPSVYTSTSSILVITKETTLASLADLQMGSQLTNDYEVMITSRPVLEAVIKDLGLDMEYRTLRGNIAINNPKDTRILEISVESPSPELSRRIVNELTRIASGFIGDKMEVVPPKVIEEGELPTKRTSPVMRKNALLGLALSAGTVGLMAVMDDTIKTEDDIEKYLGIPTLAAVPDRKDYINEKGKRERRKIRRERIGKK